MNIYPYLLILIGEITLMIVSHIQAVVLFWMIALLLHGKGANCGSLIDQGIAYDFVWCYTRNYLTF